MKNKNATQKIEIAELSEVAKEQMKAEASKPLYLLRYE